MINKIGNWVFGSFFRTIGRLLVFILLGVIIANLVDFGTLIDNFRITDLFFEKVNASTIEHHWVGDYTDNVIGTWPLDDNLGYIYSYKGNMNYSTQYNGVVSLSSSIPNINNYIYINGYIKSAQLSNRLDLECNGWDNTNHVCENWYDEQNGEISFQIWAEGYSNQCKITWNYSPYGDNYPTYLFWQAECPVTATTDQFYYRLDVSSSSTTQNKYSFGLNRSVYFVKSDGQAIIDNQNQNTQQQMQQQQQQHNEMMDSNTTQAEDEASDFLGNFTIEDTGGLNAIITAPLSTIQSLLNNTCNKLVLPLPFVSKNLELPCLYPIYNDYFGAFFTIYQTIILGIISYRCIKSLFFDVKGFTNPEDDRIEVMDL